MRAVIYTSPGEVALAEVPLPVIVDSTDAIVKVTLAGICGTDLHVVRGDFSGIEPGTVVGHEFVGEVVELGSAVRRFKPGDKVMSSDFTACGHCGWCDRGDHWHCHERAFFGTGTSFGPALAGAQAEFVRVPHADTTLGLLPPGCSQEAGLLMGDNLATGWVAVERARGADLHEFTDLIASRLVEANFPLLDRFTDARKGFDAITGIITRRVYRVAIPGPARQSAFD